MISPMTVATEVEVPFMNLKAMDDSIRDEILLALSEVTESARFALGPKVESFEESFASVAGTKHCIGVNSGTSALHLALIAAGVQAGDEVITVPMTFVATSWAIRYVGAKPVFVDIEPFTYTIDVNQVESKINDRTKAILPVHLYGQPADMQPLRELASRRGIALIEDAAQAHAATYHGQPVGSLGNSGCFSFYPGKNLGAFGEAGAVVTNDDQMADRMRALRDHAQRSRYHHDELGFNYRMDAFQGAVLGIKLESLHDWTRQRQRLAERYSRKLLDFPITLPRAADDRTHAWHLYVVLHQERERIRRELDLRGIQTGLHYPVPLHLQKAFSDLGHRPGDFPIAERVARECFSLPLFPEMNQSQHDAVIEAIRQSIS